MQSLKPDNFMKTLVKNIFFITFFLLALNNVFSQVTTLNDIGQTPGGAGFHVNWHQSDNKLIVGCGTSVWVYDMTDPSNPQIVSKRPLSGLINETEVYGDTLFVAATHDGVFALDLSTPDLDIIHHYDMQSMGDSAAYDMWRTNDTLYIADNFKVRVLKYSSSGGFTKIASFGPDNSFCVSRRGEYIVVGGQGVLYINPWPPVVKGSIEVFHISDLSTPVASWLSPLINIVQDIQFADLNDSIIYVCAGPEDLLVTKSNFLALEFSGNSINPLDTFHFENTILYLGIGISNFNVMNMDSRNDTLYIVTTAAWDLSTLPFTYLSVVDASDLPADTLKEIGRISPGFWNFDAAIMHGTSKIALSSEWLGFLVSDITPSVIPDTSCMIGTGGWCTNSKIVNNELWACHEGYGLVVYDIDSLKYSAGNMTNSVKTRFMDLAHHYYSTDFEFLNDTLLILNSSDVYNLQPWFSGGEPVLAYDLNINWMNRLKNIQTSTDQRLIGTFNEIYATTNKTYVSLFNPFDTTTNAALVTDTINSESNALAVKGDTVYYGKTSGNDRYLVAQKVINDSFIFLDTVKLQMCYIIPGFESLSPELQSISIEGNIIAVGYNQQIAWFTWSGNELVQLGIYCDAALTAKDVFLKNNLIYVADKFYGLKVFDISGITSADLVAESKGTGGWKNLYGSTSVSVDDLGNIYLSDYHAGVFLLEAYDIISREDELQTQGTGYDNRVKIYPNPANTLVMIDVDHNLNINSAAVYDISGQKIRDIHFNKNSAIMDISELSNGMYSIIIQDIENTPHHVKFIKLNK